MKATISEGGAVGVDDWKRALFSPLVSDGAVDERLLKALGLDPRTRYQAEFGKVLDTDDGRRFDFYMEASSGRRIFVELARAETSLGSCPDDETHRQKLAVEYRPHLVDHVDAKWLQPETFCANFQVLSAVSFLGRYPDSGLAFIFPKSNEKLKAGEDVIKQIVSKSLAPRVAIFYLEYFVERLLEAVADDEALRRHYLEFRKNYIFAGLAAE